MAHCMVVRLPLWAILWLQSCHYGPFYGWKITTMTRFIVQSYYCGRFVVGKLPLCPVFRLASDR